MNRLCKERVYLGVGNDIGRRWKYILCILDMSVKLCVVLAVGANTNVWRRASDRLEILESVQEEAILGRCTSPFRPSILLD
jgi:hypothetical protein